MPKSEFQYVYLLVSNDGDHRYVGLTTDLKKRLAKHNRGEITHSSKFRPWSIETAIAFRDRQKAAAFERGR